MRGPSIHWASEPNPYISVEGQIGGEEAWIELRAEPFEDEEPRFTLQPDGSLRER